MWVRITVFVDEQGFRDEFDEIDNIATHLLMLDDSDHPIATCRVFRKDNTDTYIIGRLAVVKEHRGKGLGAFMLREAENYVASVGGRYLTLHSQCRAQNFYAKCGFMAHGEIEYEENCPHIWMTKQVTTVHNMRLNNQPFDLIERGEKTIELRLYDEKRRLIKVGDTIRFTHTDDTSRTLERQVIALHTFPSFEDLYNTLPLERCGYTPENISAAHPSDMEAYYSHDEQEKYGVVGIEIGKIMKIDRIIATQNEIMISFDCKAISNISAYAYIPLVCGDAEQKHIGRLLAKSSLVRDGNIIFPRFADGYDLLICRFEVRAGANTIDGVRYVTDFSEDFSQNNSPAPEVKKPVGTWVTAEEYDYDYLEFGCMMTEINSAWIQKLSPADGDIVHIYNGKKYYFDRKCMDMYDNLMIPCIKRNIPCLIRLINRPSYRLRGSDDALMRVILHPAYEQPDFSEQMSAFNIRTEEGLDMYCAFVDFICARYTDRSSPLCCAHVLDIGNEINTPDTWHNCGPMACKDYMEEYTAQLRIAHLIAKKYYAHSRVNISLDHHFNMRLKPDALRYHSARECLAYLSKYCHRDGDFDWGIAAHPYPENLSVCDFYNDTTAIFSFDTPRITMKNMEMWQHIVELDEFKFRGKARKVVFDEQGFHTTTEDPETENKGAYAFVLAYLKMRKSPNLDWFLINRYADMPLDDEASLHLGLRYEQGYADDDHLFVIPGDYKKICFAIRDMETDNEQKWKDEARKYIGAELFDSLISPPIPEKNSYFADIINN